MKKSLLILLTLISCTTIKEPNIAEIDKNIFLVQYWSHQIGGVDLYEKTNDEKFKGAYLDIWKNKEEEVSIIRQNKIKKSITLYLENGIPFLVSEEELITDLFEPDTKEIRYYVSDWSKSHFVILTDQKKKKKKSELKRNEFESIIKLAEQYRSE